MWQPRRICEGCDILFIPNTGKQRYCTEKCRLDSEKAIKSEKKRYETQFKKGNCSINCSAKPNNSLAEVIHKANKAGMTYGQYVLKFGCD